MTNRTKRFSERIGIVKPRSLQHDDIDDALRNSLWNFIAQIGFETKSPSPSTSVWDNTIRILAVHFFKVPIDQVPTYGNDQARDWLFKRFQKLQWWEAYDLVEFLVHELGTATWHPVRMRDLAEALNLILERELSGFRVVDGQLTRITSDAEIASIEDAAKAATAAGLEGVRIHLDSALAKLGERPKADYRNSIKESISAVESAARLIAGSSSLRDALSVLEKKAPLHGGFKAGLVSLYGYTSDEDGIRHAILDEPNVGFDEAKFMLVSCSAFVHFLISKGAAAGLIKRRR